ncbi:MAG: ribonuclease H-like domain-containing protein [Planctomycetota bacterium]
MALVDKLRRIAAPAVAAPHRAGPTAFAGAPELGPAGPFWMRRSRLPLDDRHGGARLRDVLDVGVFHLATAARDPRLGRCDFRRAVFFDTETTSLGGGAGTYVFLLGAGYVEDEHFVVEQYFLREMAEERAMLEALNVRFARFELVVSFHGKGFDLPRLCDRLAFHRIDHGLPDAHLDLCLVGRSLYGGAFADCRLQTFERELVGFRRTEDLPGAECPRAFFDHLRGDSSQIPRVFEHNLHDVLTLPALGARFARDVASPSHPVVWANLGKVHEAAGRDREARRAYGAALTGLRGASHSLLPRTLERLALLERRAGRHPVSAELLRERVAIPPPAVQALEDLAKYYEHRRQDYTRAAQAGGEARRRLLGDSVRLDPAVRRRRLRSLEHRLARLRRRRGVSFPDTAP